MLLWWRAVLLATTAVITALAVVVPASPAAAHASLISTDPADGAVLRQAPDQVRLTFDERVSLAPEGSRLFDATGEPLPTRATSDGEVVTVEMPGGMDEGTYVVVYRVVSNDGHPISGSVTFSIVQKSEVVVAPKLPERPDAILTSVLSLTQGIGYLSLMLAIGLTVFVTFVLPVEARAARPRALIRRWTLLGSAVALVAAGVSVPLTNIHQLGGSLAGLISVAAWRLPSINHLVSVGLLVLGLAAFAAHHKVSASAVRGHLLAGVGIALAGASPAMMGHTRVYQPELLMILTDLVHVIAGGIWLGGMVGLAVTLPAIAGRRKHAAQTLANFSAVAAGGLGILLISGGLLTWRITGSWEALFGTRYGWILVAKVALVAAASAIACWNRFVLVPRSQREDSYRESHGLAIHLGKVVSLEAAIIVLVIGLTGFLTSESPVEASGPTGEAHAVSVGDGFSVHLTARPAQVGKNSLIVGIADRQGQPMKTNDSPRFTLRSEEVDLGTVGAEEQAPGEYLIETVLPNSGGWRLGVSLQLGEFDNPVTVMRFEVRD